MKKCLIVLASYNGEKYIAEQIHSIMAQNNVFSFINVYDDKSDDGTLEIIEKIKINYPDRIKIFKNKYPSGSAAMNFLAALDSLTEIELDQYDFIALSDQDDIWLPDKLDCGIRNMIENSCDLYFSNLFIWNQNSNTISVLNKSPNFQKYDFLFEGGSAGCTYIMSNRFLFDLKSRFNFELFNNWVNLSHDWLIYFYARINRVKIYFDGASKILYRIHGSNVHGQLNISGIKSIFSRLIMVKNGWYRNHHKNYIHFLDYDSEEYRIISNYSSNIVFRYFVLFKYNFKLVRSKKKFFKLLVVSLFA